MMYRVRKSLEEDARVVLKSDVFALVLKQLCFREVGVMDVVVFVVLSGEEEYQRIAQFLTRGRRERADKEQDF